MSKMDALRAMREARYEEAARAARPTKAAAPRLPKTETTPKATAAPDSAASGLCGHRAISGRTCTREAGHAAKSHRYA
jgi:hypothetical protein